MIRYQGASSPRRLSESQRAAGSKPAHPSAVRADHLLSLGLQAHLAHRIDDSRPIAPASRPSRDPNRPAFPFGAIVVSELMVAIDSGPVVFGHENIVPGRSRRETPVDGTALVRSKPVDLPALAIAAAHKRIGLADIGYLELSRVPFECLIGETGRQAAQQYRLGERS